MRGAFHVAIGTVLTVLLVGCVDDDSAPPGNPAAFRIVLLPDTQCYSLHYPEIFEAQGAWLEANLEALDIRAVFHLGDITEHNTTEQWEVARRSLAPVVARVPTLLSPGNHDFGLGGTASERASLLGEHFTRELVEMSPGFDMAHGAEPWNVARIFEGDRYGFVALSMEFAPRTGVLEWAADALSDHEGRVGIVVTHAYLDGDGNRYDHRTAPDQPYCPYDYGVAQIDGSDGEEIWQGLVAPSVNVRLVVSGHVPNGFAHRSDPSNMGTAVHQLMADYQTGTVCPESGGDGRGYLIILELEETEESIEVHVLSYSPWENRYRDEHERSFTITPPAG